MYSRVKRPRRPVQGMMYPAQKNKPHQTKLTGDCQICKTYLICVVRWVGHVARMGEGRCVHRLLVGKTEGKGPLARPRRGWEDNIKMDILEMGGGCGDWMDLAQDRDRWRTLVNAVMKIRVP